MILIEQSWSWEQKPENVLKTIELAGRTCYKSEHKITENSCDNFVKMIIERGHESILEHISASVRIITSRSVTHELVRHRNCAYSQESTRYINYKNNNMEFIKPIWYDTTSTQAQYLFDGFLGSCEGVYKELMARDGWKPEQAREVLPSALKTELVMTANLREWRHIFKLRTSDKAHPQIRTLMISCLEGFKKEIPIVFDDIGD